MQVLTELVYRLTAIQPGISCQSLATDYMKEKILKT